MELIILTGHRKSGTTMLHSLFDQHEGINLYPVDISILYAYFPVFTNNKNLSIDQLKSRLNHVIQNSLKRNISNYHQIEELINKYLLQLNKVINHIDLRSRADVIKGIHEAWISSQFDVDRTLPFVIKETSQSIHFEYYRNRFPDLKMVCLIRDPRDNYASIKSGIDSYYSNFGEDINTTLSSVINRVQIDFRSAWINQKEFPDSFLSIRYEDLVNDPMNYMLKISNFLGLEFSESMLIPTIMGQVYKGNNFDGKKFNSISSQQVGKWKQRIAEKEAKIIEYWLADSMKLWGYEPEYRYKDSQAAFSEFYDWYNCEYFYHDSFQTKT